MPRTLVDAAWPLRTERLSIRPATAADAASVHRHRRLPEVAEWMISLAGDLDAFAARFAEPGRLADTLVVEYEGRVVGDLMVRIEDAWAQTEVADEAKGVQAELGWAFHPDVQGRGLATEAVRALLHLCFADLGLRRVTAACFVANEPSWRLMERVGMRRETLNRAESLHRSGRWLDGAVYALLREEWEAQPSSSTSRSASPA